MMWRSGGFLASGRPPSPEPYDHDPGIAGGIGQPHLGQHRCDEQEPEVKNNERDRARQSEDQNGRGGDPIARQAG